MNAATQPKVLKSDRDYKAALAHFEALLDQPSADEAELELWSLFIETYEEEHFPIAAPTPIDVIGFRKEQQNLTSTNLQRDLQSKSKVPPRRVPLPHL